MLGLCAGYARRAMSDSPKKAARTTKNSRVMRVLARAGFAASGVVHMIIGVIAIALATGRGGGHEADQSGSAVRQLLGRGGLVAHHLANCDRQIPLEERLGQPRQCEVHMGRQFRVARGQQDREVCVMSPDGLGQL